MLRIYTVSELTDRIQELLEGEFPEVIVEGEISNLRPSASGHLYFTLKDEKAQIKAILFQGSLRFLKFRPENGHHVLCWGKISLYKPRGEYRLIVEYIEPKGIGALQLAFEQLKRRLEQEGLFDPSRKRPLPLLPRRIGIVTSPTGAVIRDMLKILKRRFENLEILIYPVRVQGEGAAQEIAEGIEYLGRYGEVDVIIVARGGGSLEDLWAFNEEIVARCIYNSPVPVISAVGHETDYTISDFVADLRAPTPSAAAEMVVKQKEELIEKITQLQKRLENRILSLILLKEESLKRLSERLKDPRKKLMENNQKLEDLTKRLMRNISKLLHLYRNRLEGINRLLITHSPEKRLTFLERQLSQLSSSLKTAMSNTLRQKEEKLKIFMGKLDALSPLSILKRGYSITWLLPKNIIVKDSLQVMKGDLVRITLAQGELKCEVKEKS